MKKTFKKDQLNKIANDLILKISKNKITTATVVALFGELGSGKTNLTQEIARVFGIKENIVSPTFVIMKKYKILNKEFKNLIHIDAYRMEKSIELLNLNWEEIISDKDNLIFIEWPEKVSDIIPKTAIEVFLSHIDDETREIEF